MGWYEGHKDKVVEKTDTKTHFLGSVRFAWPYVAKARAQKPVTRDTECTMIWGCRYGA